MLFHSLLLLYYLLMLLGASMLLGQGVSRLLPQDRAGFFWPLLSGFSLVPVATVYLALIGLTKTPWLLEVLGVLLALYGGLQLFKGIGWYRVNGIGKEATLLLLVPALSLVFLLVSKSCYLEGGLNNLDDIRSVGLTGAFATNHLKPAFLYDFSIPISYSYYLYEWSALLYAMVDGIGMPSVPVLAVNLWVVALFYGAMYEVGRRLLSDHSRLAMLLLMALLSFYGFDFITGVVWEQQHLEWWNKPQLTQMASYQHWTYQYLFASALLLLGVIQLSDYFHRADARAGLRFVALFALAAGYGAIPFVWAVIALLPVTVAVLLRLRSEFPWRLSVRLILPAAFLAAVLLLPVVFAFVGREVIVEFPTMPQAWYRPEGFGGLSLLNYNLKILELEVGPLLMLGMLLLPRWYFVGSAPGGGSESEPRRDIAWFALGIVVLSLISYSRYFDWFSRGMMLFVLIAGFSAADWLWRWGKRFSRIAVPLILLLLAPQLFNFSLEHVFRLCQCDPAPEDTKKLNAEFPLGSLFYRPGSVDVLMIKMAGRAFIGPETGNDLMTYRNSEEFLRSWIEWEHPYTPCSQTLYGGSIPDGVYFEMVDDAVRETKCPIGQ